MDDIINNNRLEPLQREPRRYKKTSKQSAETLINLIDNGISIAEAVKFVKPTINYSTAFSIIKNIVNKNSNNKQK